MAHELTQDDVGKTLVLGRNSKRKRGVIRELVVNNSMVRAHLQASGTRWYVLSLDEEVELET